MSAIPPGAREIDPLAEAERLVRKRTGTAVTLLHFGFLAEKRKLPDGTDECNYVWVKVTAGYPHPVPVVLERKIAELIREYWPAREEATGD